MVAGMEVPERATTPSGDPIMTSKFLVPAVKAPVVPRPRLFERLTRAVRGPLTLVSAPAGSGKTVLVSMWAASGDAPGPLVWISLDEEDHQPGVFWSYVLADLTRAGLDSGKMRPPDRNEVVEHSLLVRLAAALSERSAPIVLVLDNAEALTRQQIFDDLDFLLGHSAGRLRLVLVTRVDPNLPLPQYRLARSVTEIRFPELAFTPDEARQLLAGRKPELSDTAVLAFSYRTRGWAAGLRLVGVEDGRGGQLDDAVDFAGTDIALYFRTEVLDAQPPGVRDLLLSTSVVDVLYPELAVVLSGSRGAAPTLRELAQASVFVDVVPGSAGRDGGEAYAYHPLVRDLLRAQIRHQSPTRTRRLHRKAARWLAESGRTSEAMRQYAVAEDWEEAAQLLVLEHGVGRLLAAGPADGLAETFARMPAATSGPAAAVARAVLAVQQGDLVAADKQLGRAGELVTDLDAAGSALPLAVSVTKMIRAAVGGDGQEALSTAALVQSLVAEAGAPPDPDVGPLALLASARGGFLLGELAFAREMFRSVLGAVPAGRSTVVRSYALAQLALVEASAGHLTAAVEAAEEALDAGGPPPSTGTAPLGTCAAHVALAWVAADRGELDPAAAHVRAAQAEGSGGFDPVASAALGARALPPLVARRPPVRGSAPVPPLERPLGRLHAVLAVLPARGCRGAGSPGGGQDGRGRRVGPSLASATGSSSPCWRTGGSSSRPTARRRAGEPHGRCCGSQPRRSSSSSRPTCSGPPARSRSHGVTRPRWRSTSRCASRRSRACVARSRRHRYGCEPSSISAGTIRIPRRSVRRPQR